MNIMVPAARLCIRTELVCAQYVERDHLDFIAHEVIDFSSRLEKISNYVRGPPQELYL